MDFNEYDESERPTPDAASPQPQPDGSAYRGTGSGRREQTGHDPAYTAYHRPQSDDTYCPPYCPPQPAPKPKKKASRVGRRILAAVLAVVILAGCCTATALLTARHCTQSNTEQMQLYIDQKIQALLDDRQNSTGSNTNVTVTVNGLSASEIYEKNLSGIVAVTCTMSNGTSAGTGFVISEDGYLVTNYHVVENASSVKVTFEDGTKYTCTVVGYDSTNDIAVLLAEDAEGLHPLTIGKSSELKVGDPVVAIGNALGELSFSLTAGHVSGVDRQVTTDGSVLNMLQTDTAINSGNSGGPLFNALGEVVGITTAKYSGTTSSGASIEGISFAIPLDDVIGIINDLKNYGYVTGAYLGVSVSDVNSVAQQYGVPAGAHVREVVKGYCAARAGVQEGDIIIELGGYTVNSLNSLSRALRNFKAGDESTIVVWRSGERIVLSVTFDEKPQT